MVKNEKDANGKINLQTIAMNTIFISIIYNVFVLGYLLNLEEDLEKTQDLIKMEEELKRITKKYHKYKIKYAQSKKSVKSLRRTNALFQLTGRKNHWNAYHYLKIAIFWRQLFLTLIDFFI